MWYDFFKSLPIHLVIVEYPGYGVMNHANHQGGVSCANIIKIANHVYRWITSKEGLCVDKGKGHGSGGKGGVMGKIDLLKGISNATEPIQQRTGTGTMADFILKKRSSNTSTGTADTREDEESRQISRSKKGLPLVMNHHPLENETGCEDDVSSEVIASETTNEFEENLSTGHPFIEKMAAKMKMTVYVPILLKDHQSEKEFDEIDSKIQKNKMKSSNSFSDSDARITMSESERNSFSSSSTRTSGTGSSMSHSSTCTDKGEERESRRDSR